jgi:ubiquitin carboxyl-terminal hydrolase L3
LQLVDSQYEAFRLKEDEELKAKGNKYPENLFFLKQTIHNACGTIALIHAILNNPDIELQDGVLKQYYEKTKAMSPAERGQILEGDVSFTDVHHDVAQEGQTETPEIDAHVIHHFVAFVNVQGELFELDGRKSFPINHGPTSTDKFLEDAAKVCKEVMARDPEEMRFTVLGLTAA